jgi:hypothetical protein
LPLIVFCLGYLLFKLKITRGKYYIKNKRGIMSKITTLEEVKNRISNYFGDSIIICNFTKATAIADFECKICGYKWSAIPTDVGRGRGCKNCYIIRKTISREEVENRIEKIHGDTIVLLEYTAIKEDGKFRCKTCGHEWVTVVRTVSDIGTGCPECYEKIRGDKRRLSFETVKSFIESQECKLISDTYINNSTKLEILFDCGHEGKISYSEFKSGQRCKVCSTEKKREQFRTPEEKIMNYLNDNNLKFIEFPNGYLNNGSLICFSCSLGHKTTRTIGSLIANNSGCLECSIARRKKFYRGKNNHAWKGGLTSLKSYLQSEIKEWKQLSLQASDYRCTITNEKSRDLDVHHLVTFSNILKESIEEINLKLMDTIGEYSQEDLNKLILKVREIHFRYLLGVAVKRAYHHCFHGLYGTDGKTTPEQWYEFVNKVKSGEIVVANA